MAGTLRAVRFDPDTLAVGSDPVPVVEAVTTLGTGAAEFSVSRTGALVYVPGGATGGARSLVWVTRQGHEEPLAAAPPRAYTYPRLSPDGTRVALDMRDQQNGGTRPLWARSGTELFYLDGAGALNEMSRVGGSRRCAVCVAATPRAARSMKPGGASSKQWSCLSTMPVRPSS